MCYRFYFSFLFISKTITINNQCFCCKSLFFDWILLSKSFNFDFENGKGQKMIMMPDENWCLLCASCIPWHLFECILFIWFYILMMIMIIQWTNSIDSSVEAIKHQILIVFLLLLFPSLWSFLCKENTLYYYHLLIVLFFHFKVFPFFPFSLVLFW